MANWARKGVNVFGRSRQLKVNKFFDPCTPSMRKGCDRENGKKMEWKIIWLPVDRRNAERLEGRPLVPICACLHTDTVPSLHTCLLHTCIHT